MTSAKDSDLCESTWFRYAVNDQTATMIIGETWNWDGVGDPTAYDITYGREFRYDQARARYLTRVLDPAALEAGNLTTVSKVWSDYDGDVVYGDYTVSFTVPTDVRSYEPGMGKVEPWTSVGAASASYYSTDMLGTTRYMTTPDDGQKERGGATGGGLATEGATFTAFGERIGGTNHRYGYAGAHGYRAQDTAEDPGSDPVPFLHVGHRYYDPATGRFLQRDPIGIEGGLNVYAYVRNAPTLFVDPDGLRTDMGWDVPPRGYPKPPLSPRHSHRPRPRPQYRDSMWDAFWLDPSWDWLDDPRKVRRVRRTAHYVAGACTIFLPVHKLIKLGVLTTVYVYDMFTL